MTTEVLGGVCCIWSNRAVIQRVSVAKHGWCQPWRLPTASTEVSQV